MFQRIETETETQEFLIHLNYGYPLFFMEICHFPQTLITLYVGAAIIIILHQII